MATRLKSVPILIVGFGWTGAILANELVKSGQNVVAIERGQMRMTNPDFLVPAIHDELAYAIRYELFQDTSKETITFRNDVKQTALPMRQLGSFLIGDGVGGAGTHWNGQTWRFLPWDFQTRSASVARYGASIFSDDCTSADWGITYNDLEPHYDRFEYLCGIAGKAGNLNGQVKPGGNVFEGPRKREYPSPPMKTSYAGSIFRKTATELGLHPFPQPSANSTQAYKNPEGVQMGQCVYCGYCERFGCEMSAKASPQTTILPNLLSSNKFELRTYCNATRLNTDSTGKRIVSVTYIDGQGQEWEQPADLVFLCSYLFNNVKLLLLSKIGKPYDPSTGTGVVGRNYAYQAGTGATLFFEDKIFNTFMGSGAMGVCADDMNGDNFDHSGLGFVGGGSTSAATNGARPILFHPTPPGTPRWGSQWKAAVAKYYLRAATLGVQGGVQSYRGNYLDLDPTYRDQFGVPLVRMTFDFGPNEQKASDYFVPRLEKIGKAMGAAQVVTNHLAKTYSVVPYQSTHNTGGAIMGSDPSKSAVNVYSQSWDCSNLFVMGACNFPQNGGYNPTGTVGALAFRTADAVVQRYLKAPGSLV